MGAENQIQVLSRYRKPLRYLFSCLKKNSTAFVFFWEKGKVRATVDM